MSAESLSQETSSGNFETEKPAPKSIARADSSGSNDTNSSSGPVASTLKKTSSLKSSVRPLIVRTTELPKRTSSFRTPQSIQKPAVKVAPSVKPVAKTPTAQRPTAVHTVAKPVERSSSKSSLRSSRSSLNSSNSVSTVKRIPGVNSYTRAINDLTTELKAKKPLTALQMHNRNAPVAASRSNSSSGSSIAIPINKPKPKPLSTNSFKENKGASATGKPLGFMRPTASSTAKDLIDGGKPKPLVKKTFK